MAEYTTKKFLDQAGTGLLWNKIVEELNKKGQVNTVTAADNSLVVAGTASAPTVAVKISPRTGNSLTVVTETGNEGLYVNQATPVVYSIAEDTTSTEHQKVYHLTADGVNVGAPINIPKDMVVESGEVVTNPEGKPAGTYIKLVLNDPDEDELWINVGDLIDEYTSGSQSGDPVQIVIDEYAISATLTDGSIAATKLASEVQQTLNLATSALQSSDITTGTTNGTIKVKNSDVQVHGLGTAAYENVAAFDAAGEAQAVYDSIVALTTAEINAIINPTP